MSYRPEELFDRHGRLKPELADLAPKGTRRMGANPHANGGSAPRSTHAGFQRLRRRCSLPGRAGIGDTHVLGPFSAMW